MAIRIYPSKGPVGVELYADSLADVADLPTQTRTSGKIGHVPTDSTCFVIGTGGNSAMYILNSEGVWIKL